jgi:hypothetical protein
MSAAQQAKARRRQMANNYAHLSPRDRPNYKQRDAATSARRLAETVRREQERKQRKGK